MYKIGLVDKNPEKISIVTNKEAGRHGRNISVFNMNIRLKAPIYKVDEDNYAILSLLDAVTNLEKFGANKNQTDNICKYLKGNNIYYEAFIPYLDKYPKWTKNSIYNLYRKCGWE